jgi:hypothetical protein
MAAAVNTFIVRVRGKAGTWRIPDVSANTTVADIKQRVYEMKNVKVEEQSIATAIDGKALAESTTLGSLGAANGFMLFVSFDSEVALKSSFKKVNADGSITFMTYDEVQKSRGYMPGLPSMRDMQKQWNWMDFMDLQRSVEFTVKAQDSAHCTKATIDANAAQDLTVFLQGVAYQTSRIAYMYGRFTSDGGLKAAALYEPPQHNTPQDWEEAQEDGAAAAVAQVAGLLGLRCVGMVITCPPRSAEIVFTGRELCAAALKQGGAGEKSAFAIVRATATDKGQADFQAYQASDQLLEMLAAGAVEPHSEESGSMNCVSKFNVIMEAKSQDKLPTTVFLVNVPVASYESGLSSAFPKASRKGRPILKEEFAAYLRNAKAKGMPFVPALADFNLLVFLAQQEYLAPVVPAITHAMLHGSDDLGEGHKLMVTSWAEVDW